MDQRVKNRKSYFIIDVRDRSLLPLQGGEGFERASDVHNHRFPKLFVGFGTGFAIPISHCFFPKAFMTLPSAACFSRFPMNTTALIFLLPVRTLHPSQGPTSNKNAGNSRICYWALPAYGRHCLDTLIRPSCQSEC